MTVVGLHHAGLEAEAAEAPAVSRLLLIDDDLISREVLAMLALEAGFEVHAVESGEAALAWLAASPANAPEAILTDLQMPGLSGVELARALRHACLRGTPLVVMSGSAVKPAIAAAYDACLLKPFSIETLDRTFAAVLAEAPAAYADDGKGQAAEEEEFYQHLDRRTYQSLERSMPAESLAALLTMCLDDSIKRLGTMRAAVEAGDASAYTRAAHAIKGGCATVGFRQLAALAAQMEQRGLEKVDDSSTPIDLIVQFTYQSVHLRGILNTHGDRAGLQSEPDSAAPDSLPAPPARPLHP